MAERAGASLSLEPEIVPSGVWGAAGRAVGRDAALSLEAARGGHVELLRWIHDQSPSRARDAETLAAAAEAGQLQMAQWLREQIVRELIAREQSVP